MSDFFKDLQKKINKNVSGIHASVMSESSLQSRWLLTTPCKDLNRILSGSLNGGIISRNLAAIVGPEHSMKSSFMVLCMVNAQMQGKKTIILDTEGGCDENFCKRWGLDTDDLFYTYTPWIHQVHAILAQIKESGEQDLVIGLDSVGGLARYKAYTDAVGGKSKADQGLLQKEIRSMLKLFINICIEQNCVGICTGHYYGKPAKVPMPDQIGGGKAMKLFPSYLISLKKEYVEEDGKVVGNKIMATTLKNRMYPPYQQAEIMIDYKNGVRPFAGILDLGVDAGIITKNGNWYSYDNERLGNGRVNAMIAIEESFLDPIERDIDQWLSTTGYSNVDSAIREADQLLKEEEVAENE